MKTIRSYNKLVNEILNLQIPFRIEIIGYVEYDKIYPILALKHTSKLANKIIIITSGQHGTEYYAVNVLLKWIKQPILFPDFNYFIFPCVNPFGYEKHYDDNGNRQDTNNEKNFIKDSKVPELAILYEQFPHTADLILDIHGDMDKSQVYCYEDKAENLFSITQKALIENDNLLPFIKTKTLYAVKVHNGVCIDKEETGIEGTLEKLGITYTISLELPGKCEGQKRAEGGIAIINSILKNFKELK